ncbi:MULTISPECIES: hypothetical protein [Pantoea]|uniref:hypothetical protein n=1 Tax=Pantoea TaxID=53335 RepID=UPI000536083B|nr:hypothetical protein [Pantoea sp. UBA5960]AIX48823.1 hypothetical protein PSNIH1_00375 [Pantoea sp. PSNIH1]
MYKLLLVTSITFISVNSYADSVSSYLKKLCAGQDVSVQSYEASKAEKIFNHLHEREKYACKVRDENYVDFLISKYSSGSIMLK